MLFSCQAWVCVRAKRRGASVMKGGATTTWRSAEVLKAVQAVSMMLCYKKKRNYEQFQCLWHSNGFKVKLKQKCRGGWRCKSNINMMNHFFLNNLYHLWGTCETFRGGEITCLCRQIHLEYYQGWRQKNIMAICLTFGTRAPYGRNGESTNI